MTPYESPVDRQIREARERGDFENLPGAGKPLPGYGKPDDEDWWVRGLIRRENITGMLPATLLLRREVEDLAQTLAGKTTESSVRTYLDELNERIRRAQRSLLDGPPVVLRTVNVDRLVQSWREGRRG